MNDGLFKENVYGYKKRLLFVLDALKQYQTLIEREAGMIRVLDIGCGTGSYLTSPIARSGYKIVGLDSDDQSIAVAKRNTLGTVAEFFVGNIGEYQGREPFDVIILAEVIEHISCPETFMRECIARLSSRGWIIITIPNGYGWFEVDNWFWRFAGVGKAYRLAISFTDWCLCGIARISRYFRTLFNLPRKDLAPVNRSKIVVGTLNEDSAHVQHFRVASLKNLFKKVDVRVVNWRSSVPVAGKIANFLFGWSDALIRFNAFLGNFVPRPLASGWYIILEKEGQ